ncbi:MAG: hypothetical protein QNJ46_10940 [Leptolyngbyaceae cyanobacterium MO_188.B28]|nr:hypothetical protein [Leptolyngbyaceae cyanobacterium MO_188.B28]
MNIRKFLSAWVIACLLSLLIPGSTQPQPSSNNSDIIEQFPNTVSQQVFTLLSLDCGVNGELQRFQDLITELDVDISPLLFLTLREGAPVSVQRNMTSEAQQVFDARQRWLKENGNELFDPETVRRLLAQTQEDYIDETLRVTNLRYQENAIRGLGYVGNAEAIDPILDAAKREPALSILAETAVESINERQ